MSDWQKVRVSFTDADGNRVSAVMWALHGSAANGLCLSVEDDNPIYMEVDGSVKVTPIRELPTGVGAVIRVNKPYFSDTRDLYTHVGSGWWKNLEGDDVSATAEDNGFDKKSWPWEILSEGIQL